MPFRVSGVPPALADDDAQRFVELVAEVGQSRAMPSGSVLSRKWTVILSACRVAEGVGDELRSERRAADPDREDPREPRRVRRLDRAAVHVRRRTLDRGERLADLGVDRGRRRELRAAEPVMADHPVLVGVGDRAPFPERPSPRKPDRSPVPSVRDSRLVEVDPADVERQADRRDATKVTLISASKARGRPFVVIPRTGSPVAIGLPTPSSYRKPVRPAKTPTQGAV